MTITSEASNGPHPPGELPSRVLGLRQFADALPHLIWHTLPDGRFDYVNGHWRTFTGLSQAASSGDGWKQVLHADDLVRWRAAWDAGNSAGLACELEYRLRRADGAYRWFLGRAEPRRDAQGQIAGWVGIATLLGDHAPLAETAVPPGDAAVSPPGGAPATFIAAAAHDMNNELTVIRGMAQLVERHVRGTPAPEPERILSGLGMIQNGTRKLQRLVAEFLDLSRVGRGEPVEFDRQPTDLVAVARACVDEYAQTSDHELTLAAMDEPVIGQWDATRLERVVANLLSNAIKYSAPTSAIRVTVARDDTGDGAVLLVRDHGVGIPAADLPHVFEPFYRGSNVAQQTIGTGIGLFGARALIEQQGGTLRLDSMAGVGTTATLRLPLTG